MSSQPSPSQPSPQPTSTHPNVRAVQDALDNAGARDASGAPCQVRLLDEDAPTAAAAAAALGVDIGQIVKSLIFEVDGEPLLVLTSGAHQVDTERVAATLGVPVVRRATLNFV